MQALTALHAALPRLLQKKLKLLGSVPRRRPAARSVLPTGGAVLDKHLAVCNEHGENATLGTNLKWSHFHVPSCFDDD